MPDTINDLTDDEFDAWFDAHMTEAARRAVEMTPAEQEAARLKVIEALGERLGFTVEDVIGPKH